MVLEFILNAVFGLIQMLFAALPDISWDIGTGACGTFLDLIRVVTYIFPLDTFLTVFAIVVVLNNFKIIIAVIKSIWSLLPFV